MRTIDLSDVIPYLNMLLNYFREDDTVSIREENILSGLIDKLEDELTDKFMTGDYDEND